MSYEKDKERLGRTFQVICKSGLDLDMDHYYKGMSVLTICLSDSMFMMELLPSYLRNSYLLIIYIKLTRFLRDLVFLKILMINAKNMALNLLKKKRKTSFAAGLKTVM